MPAEPPSGTVAVAGRQAGVARPPAQATLLPPGLPPAGYGLAGAALAGPGAVTLKNSRTSYYFRRRTDGRFDAGRARWQQRFDQARQARRRLHHAVRGRRSSRSTGRRRARSCPDFERIGWPGEYPFTRGLYATGYRGKPWTIRQFAGFGNARADQRAVQDDPARPGGGGLSVAFDMPTLMGRDSDEPRSLGEVGHCGVAIDSAADMDVLFDGHPARRRHHLDDDQRARPCRSSACTWSPPSGRAPTCRQARRHAADRHLQGVHRAEGVALPAGAAPAADRRPDGVLRATRSRATSRCRSPATTSARPGSTAAQELAYTLADGFGYVELGLSRGLDIEVFAPGLSFFFDAHIDFFEEIAKFRAARRIWARWLRDVYGAKTAKAQWLRFHTQTAGVSLTAQQPDNNVVRTAIEALAAVLGGTNSLHTNALDEVLALPRRGGRGDRAAHPAGDDGGDRRGQRRRPARRLLVRRGADRPDRGRGRGDLRADPGAGRRTAR